MNILSGLFKLSIRFYWLIVPNKIKGKCLFDETCSRYVYRKLNEKGFKSGIKAFKYRFETCRQPYVIRKNMDSNEFELHLCNGDLVEQKNINSFYIN